MNLPGTVDITDVVESSKTTFVVWAVDYVFANMVTVPGLQWLALPLVRALARATVQSLVELLANSAVMEAFFINTAIRKASQAQDYVDAVKFKKSLPDTASGADYENAERAEINAFSNFVRLNN